MESFEHVLANINKLNRSLEGVIAVCLTISRGDGFIGDRETNDALGDRSAMNSVRWRHCGHNSRMSWLRIQMQRLKPKMQRREERQ